MITPIKNTDNIGAVLVSGTEGNKRFVSDFCKIEMISFNNFHLKLNIFSPFEDTDLVVTKSLINYINEIQVSNLNNSSEYISKKIKRKYPFIKTIQIFTILLDRDRANTFNITI